MDKNDGQPASGEAPRTEVTQPNAPAAPAPRNDAEAAAQAAAAPEPKPEPKEPEKPKRNRTGEYIHRLQTRIDDLTRQIETVKNPKPAQPSTPAPTLEQSNFDQTAYANARSKWEADNAVEQYKHQQQNESAQRQLQEIGESYNARLSDFAAAHPDFAEKVSAIPYVPGDAVQLAIMTHERGPEIAYAIANDDDLAFQLASIQPHLAAAAVERIAARLTATHEAPQIPVQPVNARPVSKAPAPVQTVSGRTASETPSEKLTDEQWWARRQKRAS
jgi:hypothetical protein